MPPILKTWWGVLLMTGTLLSVGASAGAAGVLWFAERPTTRQVAFLQLQMHGIRMDMCLEDGSTRWQCRRKIAREDASYMEELDRHLQYRLRPATDANLRLYFLSNPRERP